MLAIPTALSYAQLVCTEIFEFRMITIQVLDASIWNVNDILSTIYIELLSSIFADSHGNIRLC